MGDQNAGSIPGNIVSALSGLGNAIETIANAMKSSSTSLDVKGASYSEKLDEERDRLMGNVSVELEKQDNALGAQSLGAQGKTTGTQVTMGTIGKDDGITEQLTQATIEFAVAQKLSFEAAAQKILEAYTGNGSSKGESSAIGESTSSAIGGGASSSNNGASGNSTKNKGIQTLLVTMKNILGGMFGKHGKTDTHSSGSGAKGSGNAESAIGDISLPEMPATGVDSKSSGGKGNAASAINQKNQKKANADLKETTNLINKKKVATDADSQATTENGQISAQVATNNKESTKAVVDAGLNNANQVLGSMSKVAEASKANASVKKGIAMGEAAINTALAATSALAESDPFTKWIQFAAVIASGIAQQAIISQQKFALGTNYAPGGISLVGEQGPELVNLPRGSQVYNNSQTSKMMSNQDNSAHFHFHDQKGNEVESFKTAIRSGKANDLLVLLKDKMAAYA